LGNNTDEITIKQIEKMEYLHFFMKETLRLQPPALSINRFPVNDVQIGNYIIPKNTYILLLIYVMHRNSEYFESPEKFIPERWQSITDTDIKKGGFYIPFSDGPRVCIGQRLATTEALLLFATVVKNYDVMAPTDLKEVIPDIMNGTIRPRDLKLIFSARNKK